jgi:hypothetical protein
MPMTAFYDERGDLLGVDRGELSSSQLSERLRSFYGVGRGA